MMKKDQVLAIVRLAEASPSETELNALALRLGMRRRTLGVHLSNYRHGRIPASWRRYIAEETP